MKDNMIPGTATLNTGLPVEAPAGSGSRGSAHGAGDGGFGEALAGAHSVLDSRASRDAAPKADQTRHSDSHDSDKVAKGEKPADDDHGTVQNDHDDTDTDAAGDGEATTGAAATDDASKTTDTTDNATGDAADDAAKAAAAGAEAQAAAATATIAESTPAPTAPATPVNDAIDVAIRVATGDALAGAAAPAKDAAPQAQAATVDTAADALAQAAVQLQGSSTTSVSDTPAQATGQVVVADAEAKTSGTGQVGPTSQLPTTPVDPAGPDSTTTVTLQGATVVPDDAASTQDAQAPAPTVQAAADAGDAAKTAAPVVTAAVAEEAPQATDDAAPVQEPEHGKEHKAGTGLEHASARGREVGQGLAKAAEAQATASTTPTQPTASTSTAVDTQATTTQQPVAAQGDTPAAPDTAKAPTEPPLAAQAPTGTASQQAARPAMAPNPFLLAQERIDHIADQLATRMRLSQAAGGSQVQLHLRPRELGEVTVSLNVRAGVVTANVVADRADTGRILQSNLDELRKSLESQGLNVQQFNVDVKGGDARGAFAQLAQQRGQGDDHGHRGHGSSAGGTTIDGATFVPGLASDNVVTAEDHHDGNVSVLA